MLPKLAIQAALINTFAGLAVGNVIGQMGPSLQYISDVTDCRNANKHEVTCKAMSEFGCTWDGSSVCKYKHQTSARCEKIVDEKVCKKTNHCYYNYGDSECRFTHGLSSTLTGLMGSMHIIGAAIMSMIVGQPLERLGRRLTVMMAASFGVLGPAVIMISWRFFSYPGIAVGEFLSGFVMGGLAVSAPLYCGEMAPDNMKLVIGVFFQIFLTLGIFLASLVGLGISPETKWDNNPHAQSFYYILPSFVMLVSILAIVAAFFADESKEWLSQREKRLSGTAKPGGSIFTYEGRGNRTLGGFTRSICCKLWIGASIAGVLQLTGINAIMAYAPTMAERISLGPLQGNAVIMAWNFVTTLVSIPLVRLFPAKKLFLITGYLTALSCLFVAIPTYPGVASDAVAKIFVYIGLFLFLLMFECGVATCFYILAQSTFPEDMREIGCAAVNFFQFIFNICINFLFPISKEAFSGGASGDQDRGFAICFIIFAVLGFICCLICTFFLRDYGRGEVGAENQSDKEQEDNDEAKNVYELSTPETSEKKHASSLEQSSSSSEDKHSNTSSKSSASNSPGDEKNADVTDLGKH